MSVALSLIAAFALLVIAVALLRIAMVIASTPRHEAARIANEVRKRRQFVSALRKALSEHSDA